MRLGSRELRGLFELIKQKMKQAKSRHSCEMRVKLSAREGADQAGRPVVNFNLFGVPLPPIIGK